MVFMSELKRYNASSTGFSYVEFASTRLVRPRNLFTSIRKIADKARCHLTAESETKSTVCHFLWFQDRSSHQNGPYQGLCPRLYGPGPSGAHLAANMQAEQGRSPSMGVLRSGRCIRSSLRATVSRKHISKSHTDGLRGHLRRPGALLGAIHLD